MMKTISGIYIIRCANNNKIYVGSSKDINFRFKRHMMYLRNQNHVNNHLQNAHNKYGKNSFTLEILEVCSIDKLIEREDFWLKETRCLDKTIGFNKRDGASGGTTISGEGHYLYGKHLPQETKDKISKSRKGKCSGKNHWAYGKIVSKETRDKISKTIKSKNLGKPKVKKMSRRDTKLGERNPMSKLTNKNVVEIKKLIRDGVSGRKISELFSISQGTVCDIKMKRTWGDIK